MYKVRKGPFVGFLIEGNPLKAIYFSDGCYDYAVPEMGTVPLLGPDQTLPLPRPHINSVGSDISRATSRSLKTDGKKSPTQQDVLSALKKRLEETTVPEFPRHRLRMLSKLSEGAFGTVSYLLFPDDYQKKKKTFKLFRYTLLKLME